MTLSEFIKNSSLREEDRGLWFFILEKLDESQRKIMEDFIDGKEENLKILTENIKTKKQAFENGDKKALEKIIGGEQ
jgi:hypothetical protein